LLNAVKQVAEISRYRLSCGGAKISLGVSVSESRPYSVTPAVRRQRVEAATVHGARSERQVAATAKNQKRVILRRLGVRARDLDCVSAVLVDTLARYVSKAEMLDRHFAGSGVVRPDGQPEPSLALYFTALNGIRLTAERLGEHLRRRGVSGDSLYDYIDQKYGSNGDGGE
jgi:hypothetical protein